MGVFKTTEIVQETFIYKTAHWKGAEPNFGRHIREVLKLNPLNS